eukprot:gnl/TRDRNA2_/TRDRNA2_171740_c0_seq1.p1 gnl/TRDRNA2_/TRDRNA2_171740_c0~~gnl/TRDRNA2_/TRDRNA2_171740_c0_seq1.p1  ORF type:complete len:331 (-),score=78.26 gnl/TRDRNA2_/TRDRNA2_171740_c0_seq1:77-1069(-)
MQLFMFILTTSMLLAASTEDCLHLGEADGNIDELILLQLERSPKQRTAAKHEAVVASHFEDADQPALESQLPPMYTGRGYGMPMPPAMQGPPPMPSMGASQYFGPNSMQGPPPMPSMGASQYFGPNSMQGPPPMPSMGTPQYFGPNGMQGPPPMPSMEATQFLAPSGMQAPFPMGSMSGAALPMQMPPPQSEQAAEAFADRTSRSRYLPSWEAQQPPGGAAPHFATRGQEATVKSAAAPPLSSENAVDQELAKLAGHTHINLNLLRNFNTDFARVDEDSSGFLTMQELAGIDEMQRLSADELFEALKLLDLDANKQVSYHEFLTWLQKSP